MVSLKSSYYGAKLILNREAVESAHCSEHLAH
jgi:hypothetical protein